jgi:putative inorganic carbon (hco3(-)) transporter
MQRGRSQTDYEPVTRSRRAPLFESEDSAGADIWLAQEDWPARTDDSTLNDSAESAEEAPSSVNKKRPATFLRRGHGLTYAALFLFTIILYARPAEFYPSPLTNSIAYIVGLITLGVFVVSQITVEGTLTARPREVNLVLLFCLTGLLSIPFAINRETAWATFSDTFIRCILIFIVLVNVVRTELRLRWLLYLVLFVSCVLSVGAVNDYRLGLLTTEGYRVSGVGKGIFGNSNDLAFHFVTIVPIAIALVFATRGTVRKVLFGACAALMMAAIVVTYSRGAFLGSIASLGFLAWKLGRRHRLAVLVWGTVIVGLFLVLAPGNYSIRILSIFVPSLDPVGSSSARQGELIRSLYVAIRHPLLGIGMGNYATEMSFNGLVTHNAYTQVASEMGMAALAVYTMFVVTPLKRLGQIVRETFTARSQSRYYYLAVGLQASLIGYMVATFFLSVPYLWYVYYLVAYAVCLRRMYESETGRLVVPEKEKTRGKRERARRVAALTSGESEALTT